MNVSAIFIQFIRVRLLFIDSFVLTLTHTLTDSFSNEVLFLGIIVVILRETRDETSSSK